MSLVSAHFNPVSSAQFHQHNSAQDTIITCLAHSKNLLSLPPSLPHSALHFQFCLLAMLLHTAARVTLLKQKSGNVISLLRNHQWLSIGLKIQTPYQDLQGSSTCPLSRLTSWHSPWSLNSNHLRPAQPKRTFCDKWKCSVFALSNMGPHSQPHAAIEHFKCGQCKWGSKCFM